MTDLESTTMNDLPSTTAIELEQQGSALRIWLNRPEARNALSDDVVAELKRVLNAVADKRSIRSIVLRGRGGIFCAGGDLKAFKSGLQDSAPDPEDVARNNRSFGDLMIQLNEQPQVIIVLIEGAAIGGGLGLACIGDVTITTRDARFRLSETSLGIPPAQIAPFVTERVGLTQARRLMLTGARFKGEDALNYGIAHLLVDSADELETSCQQVLEDIALCAPAANAMTKAIVFETLRAPRSDALDYAAQGFAKCMLSDEGSEGISAFVEKRKPNWAENSQ